MSIELISLFDDEFRYNLFTLEYEEMVKNISRFVKKKLYVNESVHFQNHFIINNTYVSHTCKRSIEN